jgi:hypothetical protein
MRSPRLAETMINKATVIAVGVIAWILAVPGAVVIFAAVVITTGGASGVASGCDSAATLSAADSHSVAAAKAAGVDVTAGEGGIGFDLPTPKERQNSLHNPPTPIPVEVKRLYVAAAAEYGLPWTLLAGIGMEETNHGRNEATSSAGARGLMQFMPATFAAYGVDGNHDGRTVITDPADSAFSAAHYLVASGALRGADGVIRALLAYNDLDWYVGDVLYYAHAYGGGAILATTGDCDPGAAVGDPAGVPLADPQVRRVLAWALSKRGLPYVMGANGPDAYDCSSFTQAAYAQVGIKLPRTAQEQRDWLASGHGRRIRSGDARPGDLIFTDSYLGPARVGHVVIVLNPAAHSTIEAANSSVGVIVGRYSRGKHAIFESWRPTS